MKTFCTGLVLLALAALVGCTGSDGSGSGSAKVGGPGATVSSDRGGSLLGPKEGEFKLDPPKLSTTIKQGASDVITIGISRGKNFDEDVALSFEKVPDHVTLDPKAPVIKKGDKDAKVTVKVADDAGLGDHEITVVGKPTKGPEATNTFKIKIDKK
ncbi:MAG TPA: hypothetical protein VFW33_11170 [Gemmataceae bacterium]|nr:hypothetical protein [Gemmataceae bacterium]